METMSTSKGKVVGKRILALAIFLVCLATIIVSLALPRALRKEDETSFEPEEKKETARKLLEQNVDIEIVMKATGLSIEEIEEIMNEKDNSN